MALIPAPTPLDCETLKSDLELIRQGQASSDIFVRSYRVVYELSLRNVGACRDLFADALASSWSRREIECVRDMFMYLVRTCEKANAMYADARDHVCEKGVLILTLATHDYVWLLPEIWRYIALFLRRI